MTGDSPATPRATPWRDTIVLATFSLALYCLLAQEALHGLDVHVHVFFLTQGHLEHPFHLLYMKIIGTAWPVLSSWGLSPHHALRLLSAVGTATGIALTHRAASRLGLQRGDAALVAALSAVPPAVVFFATVPEIHGVFAAFAGLVWWTWAGFVQRTGVAAGALLGVACGLAASVHATGHLLLGLCGLCAVAWSKRAEGAPWPGLAVTVVCHLVAAASLALMLQPERLRAPFEGQLAFLRDYASDPHSLANVGRVVRDEWLLAFLPIGLCSLLALWRGQRREFAVAVILGLAVYLVAAYVLLDEINERGAYLLPLAFPFALLTRWACGTRVAMLCVVVALGAAWWQVRVHDRVEPAAWLPGFLAVARETPPAVICNDVAEQEAITRALPEVPFVRVDSLLASADAGDAGYPEFCRNFDATVEHYRGIGRTVLITRRAYEALLATGKPFFVRFLREHLPGHHRTEEIARDGFAAIRVR